MSLPILYSGTRNASSWAMRAWLALREAGVEFDEVVVDIRRPVRFENLRTISRLSPSASVPIFVIGETAIFDSTAIMEFANDACKGALLPADPVARAQARSVLAWQHAGLSKLCSRISFESSFYPLKRALSDTEQREGKRLFDHVERLFAASGGPFLFGAVSLADFALAPTVVRLSRHKVDLSEHPASQDWTRAVLNHPHVKDWMTIADTLPHIWYDEYLDGAVPQEWESGSGDKLIAAAVD